MKKKFGYLGASLALALTTVLAACGGYTSVKLGGQVYNLTTDGLVLANGSDTVAIPANATTYNFPGEIDAHGDFKVTIKSQPAHLTCSLLNATGTATGVNVTFVNVVCSPTTHALGGTAIGVTGNGLTLTNGSDQVVVPAGATTFTFPGQVPEANVYGVAILDNQTGKSCQVTNGTGVMGTADVTNVQVTCQ
jgi:RNase P/RNase MRP subunit p29